MARFLLILVLSVVTFPTCRADADPIRIVGYDIINASVSGTGGWAHVYTGTNWLTVSGITTAPLKRHPAVSRG